MAVTVVLFHAGVGWMWNVAVTGVTFFFISSTFLLAMRHPFDRLTAGLPSTMPSGSTRCTGWASRC